MVIPMPIIPSINTCMSLTSTTTVSTTSTINMPEINVCQLQALADACVSADAIAMPNIVMNSLASPTKVITNETLPNPIITAHNAIIPSMPLPITSIGKRYFRRSTVQCKFQHFVLFSTNRHANHEYESRCGQC